MRAARMLTVFIMVLLLVQSVYAQEKKTGRISGQLMIKDGGPMSDGAVFFFNDKAGPPPSSNRYWRVPDVIGYLDAEGKFSVELLEGKYYMGAVKRIGEKKVGPPDEGDYFYINEDKEGNPEAYIVKAGKSVNIGVRAEAEPFKKETPPDITAIKGTIYEMGQKPVEGAIVFAYPSPNMLGLPLFVSDRTGKDGKYLLKVSQGGKYYLRVRDLYGGGPPVAGAVMGAYGEKAPAAVEVKTGNIEKGVDITVLRQPERGPKGRQPGRF